MPLDILALAAHRDDVEQTCAGTLLKMAERGHRTGILDLTQGEMGTRGTAEDRAREAAEAARILKVSWRHALDIPDGRVENTWENRLKVVRVLREQRPRVLILPYWDARHRSGVPIGPRKTECSRHPSAVSHQQPRWRFGGSSSSSQDYLRQPVSRRATYVCRGYYRPVRNALRFADGI